MKSFCPFCEKEYDNLEVQTRYEITTLNGVTAEWQKKYIVCPDCGEELYNGELHNANLRVLYAACKVSDIYKPVEDLCDYVIKLRMENAALRERLEKAEELPCKVGDTVYLICDVGARKVIRKYRVDGFMYDGEIGWRISIEIACPQISLIGDRIFFTRAEAEARLKELKGEI